jgi:formamidopyrimidine-DNA glycosylase
MPELPEVEIMVRRLGAALAGGVVESAVAKGVGTLKSFDPPLGELRGHTFIGMRRRSKLLIVEFDGDLVLLVHLMSAGRLQLYDKPGSLKDRTLRLAIRLTDGRELRLREFGTRQSTWAKLLRSADLEAEPNVVKLGPEAWPDPPPLEGLLDDARPLHSMLRDQRVLAGIGRSWADEILQTPSTPPRPRCSGRRWSTGWAPPSTTTRRSSARRSPTSSRCP